jgi:hypothetical protein
VYRILPDDRTSPQLAALPADVLAECLQVFAVLEIVPWNGDPIHGDNPDGPVRVMPFGRGGMITYLILEDQRRVDLLDVMWLG